MVKGTLAETQTTMSSQAHGFTKSGKISAPHTTAEKCIEEKSATYFLCLLYENLLAFTEINEVDFVWTKLEPGRIFVVQCPYHAAYMIAGS